MIKYQEKEYILVVLAIFIGIIVGLLSLSYAYIIKILSTGIYNNLFNNKRLLIILIPAFGGFIVGLFIHFGSLTARGHGIPAILQTIKTKDKRLSSRDLLTEGLASAITISSGGSAGRIGPVIEIGAGIGDIIGYSLGLSLDLYRTMLGCGAAAGIAAIFNAPLGGIMFVIEIIFNKLEARRLSLIVISAISADVMVRNIIGKNTIFYMPDFYVNSPWEYLLYILVGIVVAFISYFYINSYLSITHFVENISLPFWLKPALGGLAVGIIGYFYPRILGTGIPVTSNILAGNFPLDFICILLLLKILATAITLGSGGSGGIFAPTLLIGSLGGLGFAKTINIFVPGLITTPGSYGLVAMTSLISAMTQAPLTGVLIIFELTDNYSLIIPLLLASVISSLIARKINPGSAYSEDLFKRLGS